MDLREFREFVIDTSKLILTVVVVLVIVIYVASLQQIVGPSMSPTFNNKDIAILNKLHYRFFKVKRYDIVSVEYESTKYLIKRVIGMPGDVIEYKDNILYINGNVVKEKYLLKDVYTNDFSLVDLGYDKIPEDMYLVLGDNRENSMDSREFGLIKKKDIIGKVNLRIWPINKINYVK